MPLDRIDRKILGCLVRDSGQSYASIGETVALSPPAVHERVKRMQKAGVIRGRYASLDPEAIGKPVLAFVHVDASGWGKSEKMMALSRYPEVEEIHSVAGDAAVIMKVRAESPHHLELFLSQLYTVPGVTATRSYMVLSTYLERPMPAERTREWNTQLPGIPTDSVDDQME